MNSKLSQVHMLHQTWLTKTSALKELLQRCKSSNGKWWTATQLAEIELACKDVAGIEEVATKCSLLACEIMLANAVLAPTQTSSTLSSGRRFVKQRCTFDEAQFCPALVKAMANIAVDEATPATRETASAASSSGNAGCKTYSSHDQATCFSN